MTLPTIYTVFAQGKTYPSIKAAGQELFPQFKQSTATRHVKRLPDFRYVLKPERVSTQKTPAPASFVVYITGDRDPASVGTGPKPCRVGDKCYRSIQAAARELFPDEVGKSKIARVQELPGFTFITKQEYAMHTSCVEKSPVNLAGAKSKLETNLKNVHPAGSPCLNGFTSGPQSVHVFEGDRSKVTPAGQQRQTSCGENSK